MFRETIDPRMRRRGLVMLVFCLIGLSAIAIRMTDLQIVHRAYYRQLAEANRVRLVTVEAGRGRILDRNGKVLVDNRPSYTVSILPYQYSFSSPDIARISYYLGLDSAAVTAKLLKSKEIQFLPISLKRDVDQLTLHRIEENINDLAGMVLQVVPVRVYPRGPLAPHLMGYTREVSAEELKTWPDNRLRSGSMVGKMGVERDFDAILRGIDGAVYLQITSQGKVVGPLPDAGFRAPQAGNDVYLTLDGDLQYFADSIFAGVDRGALIAMDPRTGEVLAMCSRPSFDPTLFTKPLSPEVWQEINTGSFPLMNRATQGIYPPGSILKIFTALIGLQDGKINETTKFEPCLGAYYYGDRYYHCWLHSGHGYTNLYTAMSYSCDIYFYQLGDAIGLDRFLGYLPQLRLGEPTGIDVGLESDGLIPSRAWYNKRFGRGGWGRGVLLNLVIGQGELLVTPMQMAVLTSAVANGGTIWKPEVLHSVVNSKGVRRRMLPREAGKLPFLPAYYRAVTKAMVGVVSENRGTGSLARVPGIAVAGKSGTAQNPHGKTHAWFIAFAPAEDPRICVVSLLEGGGSGGAVAAPYCRLLIERYLTGETTPVVRPAVKDLDWFINEVPPPRPTSSRIIAVPRPPVTSGVPRDEPNPGATPGH